MLNERVYIDHVPIFLPLYNDYNPVNIPASEMCVTAENSVGQTYESFFAV